MTVRNGQDARGRFARGHKLAKGRPLGSRNTSYTPPQALTIRRFRDLVGGIVRDLGGSDELSTGEMQLARRCAYISTMCEIMEAKPIMEVAELATYGTLTSHLARSLKLLGIKRQLRDVTPTLRDYIQATRQPGSDEAEPLDEPSESGV